MVPFSFGEFQRCRSRGRCAPLSCVIACLNLNLNPISYTLNPASQVAAAHEEASRGAMTKLSSAWFLSCLCGEYVRLENVLEDVVPGLFKEHDADFSGYLDRCAQSAHSCLDSSRRDNRWNESKASCSGLARCFAAIRNEIFLMLRSLHGSSFDEVEAAKVWDIAENLERVKAEEAGHEPTRGEVGVDAFKGAVK